MEALQILEEKIKTLVGLVQDHKSKNKQLQEKNSKLKKEVDKLKAENSKLAEENAQIHHKLDKIERSMLDETKHIEKLNREKSSTKVLLDDLIKSIDSLVECEK